MRYSLRKCVLAGPLILESLMMGHMGSRHLKVRSWIKHDPLRFIGQDARTGDTIRADFCTVCLAVDSKWIQRIQGHMIECYMVWWWLFSGQRGNRRERDSSAVADALWQTELQVHSHLITQPFLHLFFSSCNNLSQNRNNMLRWLHGGDFFFNPIFVPWKT